MMNFIANFFREDSKESMTRLMSFMCVLTACSLSIATIFINKDLSILIGVLLTTGLTAKVASKKTEVENGRT